MLKNKYSPMRVLMLLEKCNHKNYRNNNNKDLAARTIRIQNSTSILAMLNHFINF